MGKISRTTLHRYILILLTVIICAFHLNTVRAQRAEKFTDTEALQIAQFFFEERKTIIPEWQFARLSVPIKLFDLERDLSAYTFELNEGRQPRGHITISAEKIIDPILEFSSQAHPLGVNRDALEALAAQRNLSLLLDHPIYTGLMQYHYLASGEGKEYLISLPGLNLIEKPITNSGTTLPKLQAGDAPASLAEIESGLKIQAVRRFRLYGPDYVWYLGCGPTAVANAIGYYADRGFPNLISGGSLGNYPSAIQELAVLMDTDTQGWTWLPISNDIRSYTARRGYPFSSSEQKFPNYFSLVDQINKRHPVIILVNEHSYYGDHFITAFGYDYDETNPNNKYVMVHDTWGHGDYWIKFMAEGSETWFITIEPTAGNLIVDKIPPSSSVKPLHPYTLDTTIRLNWAGEDNAGGLGVEYYDIQYKDGLSGAWTNLLEKTHAKSTSFYGTPGHQYYFRSRARDLDGNWEAYSADDAGDASVGIVTTRIDGSVYGNTGKPILGALASVYPEGTVPTMSDRFGIFALGVPNSGNFDVEVNAGPIYLEYPRMLDLPIPSSETLRFYLASSDNLVRNSGFEEDNAAWTFSGEHLPEIRTEIAHTGGKSLFLGGSSLDGAGFSVVSQALQLPAEAGKLILSGLAFLRSPSNSDQFTLTVSEGSRREVSFNYQVSQGTWTHFYQELVGYGGKDIRLSLEVSVPALDPSNPETQTMLYLDEITLSSESGGVYEVYLPILSK